ncbi:unnamed protein product [Absidia cylindrospora]
MKCDIFQLVYKLKYHLVHLKEKKKTFYFLSFVNMKSFFPSFSVAALGIMLLGLMSSPDGVSAVPGRVCYPICLQGSLECPDGTQLRPAPQGRSNDGCFTCCKDQWN